MTLLTGFQPVIIPYMPYIASLCQMEDYYKNSSNQDYKSIDMHY